MNLNNFPDPTDEIPLPPEDRTVKGDGGDIKPQTNSSNS